MTTLIWMKNQYPKVPLQQCSEKFEILRLPFGLSQGPDFFIHFIYDLFGLDETSHKSKGLGYLAYLDDILIYSKMEKEHLDMISNTFEHLQKAGLKIKLSKW